MSRAWSRIALRIPTDRVLLAATDAPSIDGLWERRAAGPFFLLAATREHRRRRFQAAFVTDLGAIVECANRVGAGARHCTGRRRSGLFYILDVSTDASHWINRDTHDTSVWPMCGDNSFIAEALAAATVQ